MKKVTPELKAKALELRLSGLRWRWVAAALGIDIHTARRWVDPAYDAKRQAAANEGRREARMRARG